MKRVLLDTSAYSKGLCGDPWAVELLREADELVICPIVVGELLAGFRRGSREAHNRAIMRKFLSTPRVTVASVTVDTAEFYSSIFEQLHRQGTPVPVNDIWIAACAMEHGAHLATSDEHFLHIAGLLTILPTK
jgi:tRNA(fMet)-specific endonuclease VapC